MNVSRASNNQPVLQVPQDKIGTSAKQGEGEENNANSMAYCAGASTSASMSPSTLPSAYTPTQKRRHIPRPIVTTDTANVQSNFGYVGRCPSKATVGASVAHTNRPAHTAKSAPASPATNKRISTENKSQPDTFVKTEKESIGFSLLLEKTFSEIPANHLGVSKRNDLALINNRHAESETSIPPYATLPRKPSSKGAGVLTGLSKLPTVRTAIGSAHDSLAADKKSLVSKGGKDGEIKKEASGNRTEISSRFGFGRPVQRDRAPLNQACSTVQEPVRMSEHGQADTLISIGLGRESVQSNGEHKGEVVQGKALFSQPTKPKKVVSFNDEEPVIKEEVTAEIQLGQTEKKSQSSERGVGASKHYSSNTLPRYKAKALQSLNLQNNAQEQDLVLVHKPESNLSQRLTPIDSFSVGNKHVPQNGSVSDAESWSQQVGSLSAANGAEQQNTERQQVIAREPVTVILSDGDNSRLKTGVFAQHERLSRHGSSKSSSGGFTSEACDQVAATLQEKTDAQPGHKAGGASVGEVSQQISIDQSFPVVELVKPQKAGYEQFGQETTDNVDCRRKRSESVALQDSSDKAQRRRSASEPRKLSLWGRFSRSKANLMFTDIVSKNVGEQAKKTLFDEALTAMDRSDLNQRYDFLLAKYKIINNPEHKNLRTAMHDVINGKVPLELNHYMLNVLNDSKEFFEPLLREVALRSAAVLLDKTGGDALKKLLIERWVFIFSTFDTLVGGINALSELNPDRKRSRETEARDKKEENSLKTLIHLLETKRKEGEAARIALVGVCNDFMQALQAQLRKLNVQDIESQYKGLSERMIKDVQSKEKRDELFLQMKKFKENFDKKVGSVLSEQQSAQLVLAEPVITTKL